MLQGLLRGKLGFNGMIVTDASHMVGMTCMMKRSEMLPRSIAAGCDMFLFFNDMDEDFGYMLEGYKSGIITEARLQEALERILALKAHMGLHRKKPSERVPPRDAVAQVVGCAEHKALAAEVADRAVTLVKNKQEVFPITPEKYKRILIVPVKGASGGGIFAMMGAARGKSPAEKVADLLTVEGFEVSIYESPLTKMQKQVAESGQSGDMMKTLMAYFAGKTPIKDFVRGQDLILTLSEVRGLGQTAERVAWSMSKGGGEIPWYVHELPVVVASIGHPFLLADVPQAKTYINCYDNGDNTLSALVGKLTGKSPFEGVDPVDSFCGMWDTKL